MAAVNNRRDIGAQPLRLSAARPYTHAHHAIFLITGAYTLLHPASRLT